MIQVCLIHQIIRLHLSTLGERTAANSVIVEEAAARGETTAIITRNGVSIEVDVVDYITNRQKG